MAACFKRQTCGWCCRLCRAEREGNVPTAMAMVPAAMAVKESKVVMLSLEVLRLQ